MTEQQETGSGEPQERQVVIVGPDGQPLGSVPESALVARESGDEDSERSITDQVEQPAKVMRIGSMIRQLLEEVKSAPLDEASRNRLKEIHKASVHELEAGLSPDLVEELERLALPFSDDADAVRRRAPDRPGPARRLARGALPRHPDRDLRPADGRPGAVRADAPRPSDGPGRPSRCSRGTSQQPPRAG